MYRDSETRRVPERVWWLEVGGHPRSRERRGRRRKVHYIIYSVMLSRAEPERQTAPTAPRASHVSATPTMRAASSGTTS